jgi:hypothetical protein
LNINYHKWNEIHIAQQILFDNHEFKMIDVYNVLIESKLNDLEYIKKYEPKKTTKCFMDFQQYLTENDIKSDIILMDDPIVYFNKQQQFDDIVKQQNSFTKRKTTFSVIDLIDCHKQCYATTLKNTEIKQKLNKFKDYCLNGDSTSNDKIWNEYLDIHDHEFMMKQLQAFVKMQIT